MCARAALLFCATALLYALATTQDDPAEPLWLANLHRTCLRCLCEAATGCNATFGCVKGYCGPFKVSRVYWIEAGRPTLPEDDPERAGAYEDCARQYGCSLIMVTEYMKKLGKDCNGDDRTNCDDFALAHFNGGYSCEQALNKSEAGALYERRYLQCRGPTDEEAVVSSSKDSVATLRTSGGAGNRHGALAMPGYESFAGVPGRYKLHVFAASWPDARDACAAEGSRLLVPATWNHTNLVRRIFEERRPKFRKEFRHVFEGIFIGFSDVAREGRYVTLTGMNLADIPRLEWAPREPTGSRYENYGAVDRYGQLHDVPNNWRLGFLCEAPGQ